MFPIYEPSGIGKCSCGNPDCGRNSGKHPRTEHGFKDATTDPATIKRWWFQWPRTNIGIATGPVSGVMVVDVDGEEGERALEGKIPQVLSTPTWVATSSRGFHYYFRHPGGKVKSESRVLPKVDIRGDGGYIIAPPSLHESGVRYQWAEGYSPGDCELATPPAELPEFLNQPTAEDTKGREADPDGQPIPEGTRNAALTSLAGTMRWRGMTPEEITAALLAVNANRCVPPLGEDEVKRIAESASRWPSGSTAREETDNRQTGLPATVEKMNEKHAVVTVSGSTLVLTEVYNGEESRWEYYYSSFQDLRNRYLNQKLPLGRRQVSVAEYWLEHAGRRQYDRVIFAPNQIVGPDCYNLWRGFAVEPQPGGWSLFLHHLYTNICQGNKQLLLWLLAWMADAVQHPERRTGTAVVLRGGQGNGKGTFAKYFGSLFGHQHFRPISNGKHLTGNFNAHLQDCLLLFVDEAFWAGDKQGEGVLKALITEPTVMIERKGVDAVSMKNYIRVIMASNNEWVIPAGLDERRFAVFDVGNAYQKNNAYFAAIEQEMNNGGKEALLHFLLTNDFSTYPNPFVIPQTKALIEQKIHSMRADDSWWFERLWNGAQISTSDTWEDWVSTSRLQADYILVTGRTGQSRKSSETELGMKLRKWVPGIRTASRTVLPEEPHKKGKTVAGYQFPRLEVCRDAFAKRMGAEIEWPEKSAASRNLFELIQADAH